MSAVVLRTALPVLLLGSAQLLGNAQVAAADLAAVASWAGQYPSDKVVGGQSLWSQKEVQAAMRAALGPRYLELVKKKHLQGPEALVAANGAGVLVAWSCQAHDCGDNQISVFFDTGSGTAEACLRVADRSGRVQDLWFADGKARPLAPDACLAKEADPFGPLDKAKSRS